MCGICGILLFDPEKEVPPHLLHNMCDQIVHRGPDDYGAYIDGGMGMGMRRLSIIDLAGGQQPIWNEDRTCCIVYNGELYNYLELRSQLRSSGHLFSTESDTEVILHAYEEWGVDCLRQLNGMFAVAIWDIPRQRLFLARDRIGEKPLYYYVDDHRFVFASEIKAILQDGSVPREISFSGLANFLAFGHAVAPRTIYQNIYKLLPGHYLMIKDGQVTVAQYWDVGDESQPSNAQLYEPEFQERIRDLLDDSVRRRMIADVPVGAFLSGGVDSSAIVALMMRHATGVVKTFSLGFTIGGGYNELSDAQRVARYLGTEHHELSVEHLELVDTLKTLVYHYDEPFGDAASFPLYLLSRFAREHVKVVLAGDGGDELFGGYRRYAVDQFAAWYQMLPSFLGSSLLPRMINYLPGARRIKRTMQTLPIPDPATRYAHWLLVFTPEMQQNLLHPQLSEQIKTFDVMQPYSTYYQALNGSSAGDHLNRLMYVDCKTWLVDAYMEKIDKASMACSLEARLPLLDPRLIELAFQIPSRYKIRGWSTKQILKKAVADLVPPEVLNKPKHGFAVPTSPWLRDQLREFAQDVLFDQRSRQRGYFNMAYIERLWQEHLSGRHDWGTQLWLLLNFELWHRIYLDGERL